LIIYSKTFANKPENSENLSQKVVEKAAENVLAKKDVANARNPDVNP